MIGFRVQRGDQPQSLPIRANQLLVVLMDGWILTRKHWSLETLDWPGKSSWSLKIGLKANSLAYIQSVYLPSFVMSTSFCSSYDLQTTKDEILGKRVKKWRWFMTGWTFSREPIAIDTCPQIYKKCPHSTKQPWHSSLWDSWGLTAVKRF